MGMDIDNYTNNYPETDTQWIMVSKIVLINCLRIDEQGEQTTVTDELVECEK